VGETQPVRLPKESHGTGFVPQVCRRLGLGHDTVSGLANADGNGLVEGAWIMDLNGENPRQFEPIPMEGASSVRWWGG